MSIYFTMKHYIKKIRWRMRRLETARKFGHQSLRGAPVVFGNAMPKSGSHLLTQILGGLTDLGPFVDPGFPPVNRSEGNQPLFPQSVLEDLKKMHPGDIRYGYIHAKEPYLSLLTGPGRATIFLFRDPRDMVVSHVFYATQMYTGHGMHPYYNEQLFSMEERIQAAILGVKEPGFELSSVRQRYESYWGWFDQPDVLCIKFEDLILNREAALGKLLDYLEIRGLRMTLSREEGIEILKRAIAPRKSGTFRKGVPGNWREHFTDNNIATFKQAAGNLLVALGYEQDQDW